MKIGVLTSSRADYGIYKNLLDSIKDNSRFKLEIIVFGMHLMKKHGLTLNLIIDDNYSAIHQVGKMPKNDSIIDISKAYGQLIKDFASFWQNNTYDLVFALGDRWEMSAAVQSSIPYELKLAHIHGGETSEGSIDNIFRHQITLASKLHFTSTSLYRRKVIEITGNSKCVYNVGSLALEGLSKLKLPSWNYIKQNFKIPFDNFVLVTFHPESVKSYKNKEFSKSIKEVLNHLSINFNLLITKSNNDSMGSLYNMAYDELQKKYPNKIKLVSALGKLNYFKAMKQSHFIFGNSSSGIIEAASFGKMVFNIGNRQNGRLKNKNVVDIPLDKEMIINAIYNYYPNKKISKRNLYYKPETSNNIIKIINDKFRKSLNI